MMIDYPECPAMLTQTVPHVKIISWYKEIRNKTLEICAPLETEDYVPQPVEDVSPPKWHLAHTTWFFEEFILKPYYHGYQEFNHHFGFLFNSYYETVGQRSVRSERGSMSRPTVKEIAHYRSYVDKHMTILMEGTSLVADLEEKIILGLNHEQQHQELLLTDIKYILGMNPLKPYYSHKALSESSEITDHRFIKIPEGNYSIGNKDTGFSYDNERSAHQVFLKSFDICASLVSNGEYMQFINDGGYADFQYWHSEGWAWLHEKNIKAPLYWEKIQDVWHHYTLAGRRMINPAHPVTHISYYEAFAFAQWKGMRLPTEFEWEAASDQFKWGERWEWTESAYLPYPGFTKAEGAIGEYNGKFMVNQKVLRGASVATPHAHSRKTYRNFFHPHLRWQFTGIRLTK